MSITNKSLQAPAPALLTRPTPPPRSEVVHRIGVKRSEHISDLLTPILYTTSDPPRASPTLEKNRRPHSCRQPLTGGRTVQLFFID